MDHDPTLMTALEAGQLTAARAGKLPRRVFGRGTLALLVLLRIYVLLAIPIVGYAFVHALLARPH